MPHVDHYNAYHRLPTVDHDTDAEKHGADSVLSPHAHRPAKRFALVVLAVMAGLVLALRSGVNFTRLGCHSRARLLSTAINGTLPSHYTLPSGDKIPSVALGVWQAAPGEVGGAVKAALNAGYRHIDGAWIYRNEAEVGKAIEESGVPRGDIWITSKLWNTFHAPEDVEPALDESLAKLGTDYLDLYIIHWPVAFKKGTTKVDEALTADPYPTWQALEAMVAKGKVRNIGVSNFNIPRLANLTANALAVPPAVNQVELNVFNPQPALVKWCKEHGIAVEAYSPLGSTKQVGATLNMPAVKKIAHALGITPAQAVISWHVQRGTIVLPKSVTPSRVIENLQITALPEALFDELEAAATSRPPERVVNPSKSWGLGYDVFEDYPYAK